MSSFRRISAAAIICLLTSTCGGSPTEPASLAAGRWTGDGACLSVAEQCDFVAGCGHGRFPSPVVGRDGTFSVDGTYRIEVGPISIEPAPPATFSGIVSGSTLTLAVIPRDPALRPTSYVLHLTNGSGRCTVPCV